MSTTDSSDRSQETQDPASGEAAQVVSVRLSDVSSSLRETAERLREAMEAGTLPRKAAAEIISRLEDVAAKASDVPTLPQE